MYFYSSDGHVIKRPSTHLFVEKFSDIQYIECISGVVFVGVQWRIHVNGAVWTHRPMIQAADRMSLQPTAVCLTEHLVYKVIVSR